MISKLLAIVATLSCLALVSATCVEAQSTTDLMKQGTGLVQPLDLNTASVADLKKLPGVGDGAAQKIVAGRPFSSTTELVDKNILSAAAFDKVKGLVTVGK
jgi:DNA uptake protein ComE-like DNA-binding protein